MKALQTAGNRVHSVTMPDEQAKWAIQELWVSCCWFEAEPWPDDFWRLTVKHEEHPMRILSKAATEVRKD